MKRVIKVFIYLLLIVSLGFLTLFFFALQSKPWINQAEVINAESAQVSKRAISRVVKSFTNKNPNTLVSLSAKDLKSISALANRSVPNLVTDISLQQSTAMLLLSYKLPLPEPFSYLNVSAPLYSSNFGLLLGDVDLGGISFSGKNLMKTAQWLLNNFAQPELGDKVFSMVQWVNISPKRLLVKMSLAEDMINLTDQKSSLIALRDQLALFGDVEKVSDYYQKINAIAQSQHFTSLTPLLAQLSREVKSSLRHAQNARSAEHIVEENRSALTALVIYLGSDKFEHLVGDVARLTKPQIQLRNKLRASLTLHQRVDLQKHFVYSIALQLFSSQTTSDAIGEMKEFIDSNKGGTGFSFADLLADRAGTRLAKLANDPLTAHNVLEKLAQLSVESELIPAIDQLPEGLSKQAFERDYKHIHSSEYKQILALIDGRINQLSLYQ